MILLQNKFCKKLSEETGREDRLPSEAEWEYACRAGTETPFYFGETLSTEIANYDGNYTYRNGKKGIYRQETVNVDFDKFPANGWGLSQMHGNVWEWCEDDWHDNYDSAPDDGRAWIESDRSDTTRVLRGGSYSVIPWLCRSAVRYGTRDFIYFNVGFRVVVVDKLP